MKKKLIISTLFVAVVAVANFFMGSKPSSNTDLAGLITLNAAQAVDSEGCKPKINKTCWALDGQGDVFGHCQERVLFNGNCDS